MSQLSQETKVEFEPVIGLEVHLQFNTQTKIFCSCANGFGREPNSQVCPVCLGLPGTLPVLNKKALEYALKVALALNCKVNPFIKFDRKNYYYPDLPKGYQISQFDFPIARDGYLDVPTANGMQKIRIHRAHLEEDAGKLIHDDDGNCSLVDYNRTGTPLMEIVTEADMRSPQEAYDYLHFLKLTLQYLNVSDCDMEKGSLRCDANVSIRPKGQEKFGTKTEIKNMNSFRAVKNGLEYEITRQKELVESGARVTQETRLWNEAKGVTIAMRSKEEAHDYRYFPEPDLVPFIVDESVINAAQSSLPELPLKKLERLLASYKISDYNARILIQDPEIALYFEKCAKIYSDPNKVCNWIIGPLLSEINTRKQSINNISIKPEDLTTLIKYVEDGSISNLAAKEALTYIIDSGKSTEDVIKEKGLIQVSDESELIKIVDEIIAASGNEKAITQIKEGKESAIGFLVGQAMKKSSGKANPKKLGELIKRRLLNA